MALPSGTYSNTASGPLQIFFSGQWSATSFDFGTTGPSDIVLTCSVTDGTTTKEAVISMVSRSAVIDWDYVGSTTITCSMTETYWNISGAGFVIAEKLLIRAVLIKR